MTLRSRIVQGNSATGILLVSGGLAAVLGYVWTLIASRFMPAGEYADFTAAVAVLYFVIIAIGPVSQSIAYFVASANDEKDAVALASSAQRGVLSYGGLAFIVFSAASPLIARELHFRSAISLVFVFCSAYAFALLSVRRGFVQGASRFTLLAGNVVLEGLLRIASIGIICAFVPTADGGIASYALAILIAVTLLPSLRSEARKSVRPMLRYFGGAFLSTAIYSAMLNSDVIFAKLFFAPGAAAVYGAASFIGRAAAMLVMPFYVFAVPHLVAARADPAEMRRRARLMLAQYTTLSVATVIVIGVARNLIVTILLGPTYAAASQFVVLISVAVALEGFAFFLCQLPVARADFRFIPWYAMGYLIEIAAVARWHSTARVMLEAVIGGQIATIAFVFLKTRTRGD